MIFTIQESTKLKFSEFNNKESVYYCPKINTFSEYKLSIIEIEGKVEFIDRNNRVLKSTTISKDFNFMCKGSLYEIETDINSRIEFEITHN